TGMGAAAATILRDHGAHVIVTDIAEPSIECHEFVGLDLRDRAAIDACVDGIDAPLDVVLSCAGVADGTPGLPEINFIGHRHLLARALDRSLLGEGSAIAMIASIGGISWQQHLDEVLPFLDTPSYEDAVAWLEEHPELANYGFTK